MPSGASSFFDAVARQPRDATGIGELNAPLSILPLPDGVSQMVKGALLAWYDRRLWYGTEAEIDRVMEIIYSLVFDEFQCNADQMLSRWRIIEGKLEYELIEDQCSTPPVFEIRNGYVYQGYEGEPMGDWINLGYVQGPAGATYVPSALAVTNPSGDVTGVQITWTPTDGGPAIINQFPLPMGPQGEQGPPGQPGQDGQDGGDGQPGQDGEDGETWLPFLYTHQNGEVRMRWIAQSGVPPYNEFDPLTYLESPQDLRGPKGEDGDASPVYFVPHTYQYPNGQIKLRWASGSGVPPYDPDNPATYLETQHNIRGAQGIEGPPGDDSEAPILPPTSEIDAYCYAAGVLVEDMALWIFNNYYVLDWVYDTLQQIIDEIPFVSIVGAILEAANELTDAIVDATQTVAVKAAAKELVFCLLVRNEGLSNTEIAGWYNDHYLLPEEIVEHGPAGLILWMILFDATASPHLFRKSVEQAGYRSMYFDDRDCRTFSCIPSEVAWGITFNFNESCWDFQPVKGWSGVCTTTGWVSGYGNTGGAQGAPTGDHEHVDIRRTFNTAGRIDRLGVTFELTPGGAPPRVCLLYVGNTLVKNTTISAYGPGTYNIEWSAGTPIASSVIRVLITAGAGTTPAGEVKIVSILMAGPDTVPT